VKGKQIKEVFIKSLLGLCGTVSSIAVILIIVFLFREGFGLFSVPPVSEGYALVINESNPVKELDADQIRLIYESEIVNWKMLGGNDEPITVFDFDYLSERYDEEQLGESFENLSAIIQTNVESTPGIFAIFPEKYMPDGLQDVFVADNSIIDFITGESWYPTAKPAAIFGILPIILGTLWVTLGSIIIAIPLGLGASIYMAEIAHPNILKFLKPTIELLAGIPSVVYGFFGLVVIVPYIQSVFNLAVGETALAGSIMLGIIALPTIITLSEDAIRSTPKSVKMASLALGATHWQTIVRVIVPYSISGITTASILGVGRAIGETMAVLMVTGNAAVIPGSFLEPVRTIPATIAAELGEAPIGGAHYKALFVLGCILFIFTFLINTIVEIISSKKSLKKG
jgi:phosphate transport system permease protein